MSTIKDKIRKIFISNLNIKKMKYGIKISRQNLKAWDSQAHINLMMNFEGKFNISFTYNELINLDSVEKIEKIIKKKIEKK